MQEFDKPGVYKTKEDIEIKHVIKCFENYNKPYPVIVDAVIPKDSTIVHSRKYKHNIKMTQYGSLYGMSSNDLQQEIPNNELRTNQIMFTDIKKRNDLDKCYLRRSDQLLTDNRKIQSNTLMTETVNTDIDKTYGNGLYFSRNEDVQNNYDYESFM